MSLLKGSLTAVVWIVVLSLAVWVFFYANTPALSPAETFVVVAFCAAAVFIGKWLLAHLPKSKEKK